MLVIDRYYKLVIAYTLDKINNTLLFCACNFCPLLKCALPKIIAWVKNTCLILYIDIHNMVVVHIYMCMHAMSKSSKMAI